MPPPALRPFSALNLLLPVVKSVSPSSRSRMREPGAAAPYKSLKSPDGGGRAGAASAPSTPHSPLLEPAATFSPCTVHVGDAEPLQLHARLSRAHLGDQH